MSDNTGDMLTRRITIEYGLDSSTGNEFFHSKYEDLINNVDYIDIISGFLDIISGFGMLMATIIDLSLRQGFIAPGEYDPTKKD